MGDADAAGRTQLLADAGEGDPAAATQAAAEFGVTLRPNEAAGHTQRLVLDATQAAENLPRISVSLGAHALEELRGRSELDLQFLGLLGEGGMGRVLLARQRSLQREVAVKTSKPNSPKQVSDALIHEGVITGRLEHPGIVPVHSLALDQAGRPVVVMKRIEGVEWGELLQHSEHPAWSDWLQDASADARADERLAVHLEILMRVSEAVHFAHSRGIIHRDLKPENVMLGRFREVYLGDWGIALQVEPGHAGLGLAGTPAYMAPEMVRGGPIDARTDVYLLGATLHHVLVGSYRHAGDSISDVLSAAETSAAYRYPTSVPDELGRIANQAAHRDPAQRFHTVEHFRLALRDYLQHRSSLRLSREAMQRLEEAEALLSVSSKRGATLGPRGLRDISDLLGVARFGFGQALEIWRDNQEASKGQRLCLERLVDAELLGRDARRAREWLQQLEQPPTELASRLVELELQEQAAAERERALEDLARDLDGRVASRQRVLGVVFMGLAGAVLSVFALYKFHVGGSLTHAGVVGISLFMLLSIGAWAGTLRKSLLRTAFNRRLVGSVALVVAGMLINRLLGWAQADTVERTLSHDQVILAVGIALCAVCVDRRLGWMLPPVLIGIAVSAVQPQLITAVFSITTALAAAGAVWVTRSDLKSEA